MFEQIVVPVDNSHVCADASVGQAVELAEQSDGRIHLVHVVDGPDTYPDGDFNADVKGPLRYAESVLEEQGYSAEVRCVVLEGSPEVEICGYVADVGGDVVVMATHGRSGLSRLAVGSVTESVLRRGPCPVLAIQPFND